MACLGLAFSVSCNDSKKNETPKNEAINLAYMDTSVRPQDNFYEYVNGNWMKKTQIPSDKASWGSFQMLREETAKQCLTILDDLLKTNPEKGSEAEKIKNLYQNYIDWNARNKNGLSPIEADLQDINQITSLVDFQNYLVKATLKGFNPFYDWSVYADMKNSKMNAVYLGDISLGLGRDYFQKETPDNAQTLAEYQKYVAKILTIIGENTAQEQAQQIVHFEKKIANQLLKIEETRDANKQYNLYEVPELAKLVKNINLPDYLQKVGVKTPKVVISELNYYKNLDTFLSEKNIPLLKSFLKYKLVAANTQYLTKELDDLSFHFYGKYLQGKQEQEAMNKRALNLIDGVVGEAFGKLYVEKYFSQQAKNEMLTLINYLQKSFEVHIKNLAWMSAPTKEKALKKLGTFMVKVGYPNQWKNYSELEIRSNKQGGNLYENVQKTYEWLYKKNLLKIGKAVDKTEWAMLPQTVNAYYNPLYNEIVFPAAILQPPFFSANADPAVNFGGIGAVIGHEMTHGFDDSGALYDSEGNLSNWWSEQDKINFDKATNALAEQFNTYEPIKGHFVNGKFTNGENIADLGGVAIAFDALQMYLKEKGSIEKIDGFTQNQRFFLSWGTIWRNKSTEKYIINQLKTDEHSPAYFRSFAPLVNFDAFYQAFNLKEGDKLYKKPQNRIRIW